MSDEAPSVVVTPLGRVAAPQGQESTSGKFYFWIDRDKTVERTQIVTTRSTVGTHEVKFIGIVLEVYRRSHALLHVSWTEGVPQVLFEAFAARLPVVATAVGGVPEAAGGAAILVPPGDAEAPAAALARLGADAGERERLIEAGLEKVESMTLERQARTAIEFIAG